MPRVPEKERKKITVKRVRQAALIAKNYGNYFLLDLAVIMGYSRQFIMAYVRAFQKSREAGEEKHKGMKWPAVVDAAIADLDEYLNLNQGDIDNWPGWITYKVTPAAPDPRNQFRAQILLELAYRIKELRKTTHSTMEALREERDAVKVAGKPHMSDTSLYRINNHPERILQRTKFEAMYSQMMGTVQLLQDQGVKPLPTAETIVTPGTARRTQAGTVPETGSGEVDQPPLPGMEDTLEPSSSAPKEPATEPAAEEVAPDAPADLEKMLAQLRKEVTEACVETVSRVVVEQREKIRDLERDVEVLQEQVDKLARLSGIAFR